MKKYLSSIFITAIAGLMILAAFSIKNWYNSADRIYKTMYLENATSAADYSNKFVESMQNSPKGTRNNYTSPATSSLDLTGKVSSQSNRIGGGITVSTHSSVSSSSSNVGTYHSGVTRKSVEIGSNVGSNMMLAYAASGKRSGGNGVSAGGGVGLTASAGTSRIGSGTATPMYKLPSGTLADEDDFETGGGTNPGGSYNDAPAGEGTVLLILLAIAYGLFLLKKRTLVSSRFQTGR